MPIEMDKPLFDENQSMFIPVWENADGTIECYRRPPLGNFRALPAEVEALKASGTRRTYVRGGETRIQTLPVRESFIPSLTSKGRPRARGYTGPVVSFVTPENMHAEIVVTEAEWLAWLGETA